MSKTESRIEEAGRITMMQNLAKVPSARNYAMAEMRKAGVQFHSLSEDQLNEWRETVGYQRSEWDSFKMELAGDMDTFNGLAEAAETYAGIPVDDA